MPESLLNLLGTLMQRKGQELRLEPNQPAQVVTANGPFMATAAALSTAEIGTMVLPIFDDTVKRSLTTQPEVSFDYQCSGVGNFAVVVRKTPQGLTINFRPQRTGASGALSGIPNSAAANIEPMGSSARSGVGGAAAVTGNSGVPQPVATVPAVRPSLAVPMPAEYQAAISAAAEPPAVRQRMEDLLYQMAQRGASDLHLSVSVPPMIRKDGRMERLHADMMPLTAGEVVLLLTAIMPQKNLVEFEQRKDSDFAYEVPDLARFRCNVFMDRKGMGGVFRMIPHRMPTVEQLGLPPAVIGLTALSKGLVLVTGPTGSGKSTTLAAMIDHVNNTRHDHLITIEDPIEFVHENKLCLVNQREVYTHAASFKDALRAALREDPDIVLVGELRDLETMAIAIETAETGHLVFGTLHTSSAAGTVDRIIEQFPTDSQAQIRVMLSESLRGVITQSLLRKKGGGRVAAMEVLIVTSGVSNLIREGKSFQIPSAMQTGKKIGMATMNDALIDLVRRDLVEAEEAYIKTTDKAGFEALLRRNNIDTLFIQASAER